MTNHNEIEVHPYCPKCVHLPSGDMQVCGKCLADYDREWWDKMNTDAYEGNEDADTRTM